MNIDQLRRLLCERMCADVTVEERPDGDVMIVSPFRYPDGDGYPIHLSHPDNGVGVRLSDRGHTLMYISYEHDVDSFTEGNKRVAIEKILTEHGITFGAGAFMVDTQPDQIPDALFRLGQGITGVCNLATTPRAKVNDEFYRKLDKLEEWRKFCSREREDILSHELRWREIPLTTAGLQACSDEAGVYVFLVAASVGGLNINDVLYVGQTTNLRNRLEHHLRILKKYDDLRLYFAATEQSRLAAVKRAIDEGTIRLHQTCEELV